MLHRTRDLLMRQRTQLINALRAHLAELGIVAAQGREGVKELLKIIASEQDARLPVDAHASLVVLAAGSGTAEHRSDEASKRLRSIPGIGIVGATTIAATVPDAKVFRSGRDFAAWIGSGTAGLGFARQAPGHADRFDVVGGYTVGLRAIVFFAYCGARFPNARSLSGLAPTARKHRRLRARRPRDAPRPTHTAA